MAALNRDVISWIRQVAVTAVAVTLGFIALSVVTGHAYVGLPAGVQLSRPLSAGADIQSPHGADPACASCHRTHTAFSAPLLVESQSDSSVCTQCHNASGTEEKSTHSNVDYGGATQPAFYVACTACHDPHGDPNATGGNKAMIRMSIGGLAVNFHSSSGDDSYDDGLDDGSHDSLCVACHATTSHNNVSSPEFMGQGHEPVGTDCTSCHQHGSSATSRSGFMPQGGGGSPTLTATPTDTPIPPTETATSAPSPTDTPIPPTDTAVPLPTDTEAPATDTPTPTPVPTDTPVIGG
jgi:predicted CXXCH cytochrome family protein